MIQFYQTGLNRLISGKKNAYRSFTMFLMLLSCVSFSALAQDITVSGKVTGSDGDGIPGVTVQVKGTSKGTQTDLEGKYTIAGVSSKGVLTFSFVGMSTSQEAVNGRSTINVVLSEDSQVLDEVVVVGYGTVKKSDLTGAVSVLSGEVIAKQPIANVAEALTGRLAGVQVTSSEGSPDSEINIRIRGGGSLSQDASPLLIVDGFPVNSINDIACSGRYTSH